VARLGVEASEDFERAINMLKPQTTNQLNFLIGMSPCPDKAWNVEGCWGAPHTKNNDSCPARYYVQW